MQLHKKGEKNRYHMMRSHYILSFLPSLLSSLPPFFSHKLRQIHMGCELWRCPTSKTACLLVAVSHCWWNNLQPDITRQISQTCNNARTVGFLTSFIFSTFRHFRASVKEQRPLLISLLPSHPVLPHSVSPRLTLFASIIKYPTLRNLNNVAQMEKVSRACF